MPRLRFKPRNLGIQAGNVTSWANLLVALMCRWDEDIKIEFKYIYFEAMDWTYRDQSLWTELQLCQSHILWRALAKAVVNLLDVTHVKSSKSIKWLWR